MEEKSYPFEVDTLTAAADIANGATLLDVREPGELAFCKIDGSLNIPMGQIPHRLSEIPKEGALYVLCHHGMRSGQVTTFFKTTRPPQCYQHCRRH
jgi:rhodanese-related sulfurtransferase